MLKHFISPQKTIELIGIDRRSVVMDFGAGSGHWTFAAAKNMGTSGKVIAIDTKQELLKRIDSLAILHGYGNIVTKYGNFLTLSLKDEPLADLSILAGTLSFSKNRDIIIKKVFELTKKSGKLLVVEWIKEDDPVGPPKKQRLSKKEVVKLAEEVGFTVLGEVEAGHYHYGIVFEK